MVFHWGLTERDGRFSGDGVTRVAAPYRARLDLFGPRGETYLSAALVGMDLRIPQAANDAPLPPPALFWSALGVFRPPPAATLVGTARDGSTLALEYARGEEHWRFQFRNNHLRHAEWQGPGKGRRTVELKGEGAFGLPRQAVYRDWIAFRELKLELREVEEVHGFPADTWRPGLH